MTDDERRSWVRERGIPGYAADLVRSGVLGERAAQAKAVADYADLDPGEGVSWRVAETEVDGVARAVGGVAWSVKPEHGEPSLFVLDVEVDAELRGRGLGRAIMAAVVDEAVTLGVDRVGLTVWAGNDVARSLYESLGFRAASTSMWLRVPPAR
jgi:ribosomal protein S18 acetylase RimI-like enzyme